jgi:hypothetical protein
MRIENFTQLYNLVKGKGISPALENSVNDYISECNCRGQLKEQKRISAVANYIAAVNYLNSNKPLAFSLTSDTVLDFYNDGGLILSIRR